MRAHASLVVEHVDGRARCTELRSDPPLSLRETPTGVHLVASGAGPVGGDQLALTVRVGPSATLDLRSVAASMVHPGPSGRPSTLTIDLEVGDGATLRWTPQPSILVRGCDHHMTTRLRLGAGATVVWREEVVLGRHGEEGGSVLQRLLVDGPDGPILRNDLAVGPSWPGSLGPGGIGSDVVAVGSLLAVDPGAGHLLQAGPADLGTDGAAHGAGVRWAATALAAADSVLVTAVTTSAGALGRTFDALVGVVAQRTGDPVTTR